MNDSNLFIYEDVRSLIRILCSNSIAKLNVFIEDLIMLRMSLIGSSLSWIAYSRFAWIGLLLSSLLVRCNFGFVVGCYLFEPACTLNPNFGYWHADSNP